MNNSINSTAVSTENALEKFTFLVEGVALVSKYQLLSVWASQKICMHQIVPVIQRLYISILLMKLLSMIIYPPGLIAWLIFVRFITFVIVIFFSLKIRKSYFRTFIEKSTYFSGQLMLLLCFNFFSMLRRVFRNFRGGKIRDFF